MTSPRLAGQLTKTFRMDRLLAAELGALAFLLGCYELFDPDIWWHLKSGQWILDHRRIPFLDIFTYSSSNRVWVDLHWGFQVALALAYGLAGVAGMILMAAAAGCATVVIAMTARAPHWPRWVAVLCWLPALALMAMRFDPRPEIFSLLYLASFLAILFHAERRPVMAWCLPFLQVLWVNTHALFILGPIVLGCFILDRVTRTWLGPRRSVDELMQGKQALWRHLLPVSAAVVIACLINPYGARGALFPMELFPKISDPANPYKAYVDEFSNLRMVVLDRMMGAQGAHPHIRTQIFLLLALPWSFVLPAAWENWRSSVAGGDSAGINGYTRWAAGLIVASALALAGALGMPLPGTPRWLVGIGEAAPATMLVIAVAVALPLSAYARIAAATLVTGAAAAAIWTAWMSAYLFDDKAAHFGLTAKMLVYCGAGLGALSAAFMVRAGTSAFRLLLVLVFTYLSFQAIRNINLFGLVAGAVLAWNVSEWLAKLRGTSRQPNWEWLAPAVVSGLIALWAAGIVTDRYYSLMGDTVRFGLRERPLTFGHSAARFAGRPGLPTRALVFDLGQTGVYIYHNGPERKVFMDARLELPSFSTFQTYVRIEEWLNHSDARWDAAIARLGDPLVLISHDGWTEAEAALLTHPRWRCLYFDAIASVFVTREGPSSVPTFPDHDFMAAHFATDSYKLASLDARSGAAEVATLIRLARAVRKRGDDPWRTRIPILTRAASLTRALLAGDTANPASWWRQLGLIQWEMAPDLTHRPPGPADPWDPATGLSWARATYCFRRAIEAKPDDEPTLRSLAECFGIRGMDDAKREVESALTRKSRARRTGTQMMENPAEPAGMPWSTADRLALNYLHLGQPELARKAWNQAAAPASAAGRLARLAGADLVALDPNAAAARCQTALDLDPTLGDAWYLLTVATLDLGLADAALAACRGGLKHELTAAQRQALAGVERLLSRHGQSTREQN